MTVKVYLSLTSGLKEVKKRQQKILMILDSKNIKYEIIDISEPGKEEDKDFMQTNSTSKGGTASDPDPRHPLPPQVFNDGEYCGDFEQFELANEVDNLEDFLKLPQDERPQVHKSTLDTSKIDENHPNGKVIEDDKPADETADENKENKTEDQGEGEKNEYDGESKPNAAENESVKNKNKEILEKNDEMKGESKPTDSVEISNDEKKEIEGKDLKAEEEESIESENEADLETTVEDAPPEKVENTESAEKVEESNENIKESESSSEQHKNKESETRIKEEIVEPESSRIESSKVPTEKEDTIETDQPIEETLIESRSEYLESEKLKESEQKSPEDGNREEIPEDGEFGDRIIQEKSSKEEKFLEIPLSATEPIVEEEEEEIELESESLKKEIMESTDAALQHEITKEAPKELTESEKLILSEQEAK